MKRGPTNKIPWILYNDECIGDSTLIYEWMIKRFDFDIDAQLTNEQRAIQSAFQRYLEEYFYFIMVNCRWTGGEKVKKYFHDLFGSIFSWFMMPFILKQVKKGMKEQLYQQGTARFPHARVIQMGEHVLDDISCFLGSKTWFMGLKKPTLLDFVVFAFVLEILEYPEGTPELKAYLDKKTNLIQHCNKMYSILYPETK